MRCMWVWFRLNIGATPNFLDQFRHFLICSLLQLGMFGSCSVNFLTPIGEWLKKIYENNFMIGFYAAC